MNDEEIVSSGRQLLSRPGRVVVLSAVAVLISPGNLAAARDYIRFQQVARTGNIVAPDNATITFIKPEVSINSSGKVAFVASVSGTSGSGEVLVVASPSGTSYDLERVSVAASSTRTYFSPQINDDDRVVLRDRVSTTSQIRTWGPETTVSQILASTTPSSPFIFVTLPARAETGEICFVAEPGSPPSGLYANVTGVRDDSRLVTTLSGGGFRPVIAGGGDIVIKDGIGSTGDLKFYERVLPPVVAWNPTTIASTSSGWDAVGAAAGVSSDGEVVAFYGKPAGQPGGIFIWLPNPAAPADRLVRLCQPATSVAFGFGDLQWTAPENEADRILPTCTSAQQNVRLTTKSDWKSARISSFVDSDKVCVDRLFHSEDFDIYRVAFEAGLTMMASPGSGEAIWTATVLVKDGKASIVGAPQYFVGTVEAVELDNVAGSPVVLTNLSLYDGLGGLGKDGELVFRATDAGGVQYVITGRPVLEALRQNQLPWGDDAFGGSYFADYANALPTSDASRAPTMNDVLNEGAYTISAKGCVLSSLAMAMNVLHQHNEPSAQKFWSPDSVQEAGLNNGLINRIDRAIKCGTANWSHTKATRLPVLDGADLLATSSKMESVFGVRRRFEETFVPVRATPPASKQADLQRIWNHLVATDSLAALGSRPARTAILNRSGHRFLAAGISDAEFATRRIYVVDPYVNFSEEGLQSEKDKSFEVGEFTAFQTAYGSIADAYFVELASTAPSPSPPPNAPAMVGVTILSDFNLDFVVTMPGGDRTGCDPLSGTDFVEIAGAIYYNEIPVNPADDLEYLTPQEIEEIGGQGRRCFQWSGGGAGNATVQLFGTEDFGEVTVEMRLATGDGTESVVTRTATVGPGANAMVTLPLGDTPVEEVIKVSSVEMSGRILTIRFVGYPGVTNWQIFGANQSLQFDEDRTADTLFIETVPGSYTATLDVSDNPAAYFVRIQR